MTGSVGDALSHMVQPRFPESHFSPKRRRERERRASSEACIFGHRPQTSFHASMHGPMSHLQERQISTRHSITRNTCSTLVASHNDLTRQYFQVIYS